MNSSAGRLAALLTTIMLVSACSSPQPVPSTATAPPPTNSPEPTLTPPPDTPTPVPTATATPLPMFWDDFNGELLEGWTWIRENDALWSLTAEPGFLRIVLESGRYHRNLPVREVDSGNFQIMTHVLFEPTSNFQFAGLTVYQDDETQVSFGRAYCDLPGTCVGNGVYFDALLDGQFAGSNFATDTPLKDEAYLRIDKVGHTFRAFYSEDGSNWTLIGEHVVTMLDPKVGLMAGQSNVVGATALFDYFTVMELP